MNSDKIIDAINEELKRRGWSQAKLARLSDVSTGTISKILQKKDEAGSPVSLAKIARTLGIPEEQFFMDAGIMREKPQTRRNAELLRFEELHSQLPPEDRKLVFEFANMLWSKSQGTKRKPIYEREHR